MTTEITIKNNHPADQSGHAVVLKQFYKDGAGNASEAHQSDNLAPGETKNVYLHSGLGLIVEEGEYITVAPVAEETTAAEGQVAEVKTECCDAPEECGASEK